MTPSNRKKVLIASASFLFIVLVVLLRQPQEKVETQRAIIQTTTEPTIVEEPIKNEPETSPSFFYGKTCHSKFNDIQVNYTCNSFNSDFIGWSNKWEREHLELFKEMKVEYMISYGEWEGPTALYWLNLNEEKKVVAFEPNPQAFSRLFMNMEHYGKRAFLNNMCINTNGEPMYVSMFGQSGDKVSTNKEKGFYVNCLGYSDLILETKNYFHKVDVEGFEEHLIDNIIANPPLYLSISVHEPFISNVRNFNEKMEILKEKYKKKERLNEPYNNGKGFYEMVLIDLIE